MGRPLALFDTFRDRRRQLKVAHTTRRRQATDRTLTRHLQMLVPLLEWRPTGLRTAIQIVTELIKEPPVGGGARWPVRRAPLPPSLPRLTAAESHYLTQHHGRADAATQAAAQYLINFTQVYGAANPRLVQRLAEVAYQWAETGAGSAIGKTCLILTGSLLLWGG
jgi:hypothetical protein